MNDQPTPATWVEEIHLLGAPSLSGYVERVRQRIFDVDSFDVAALIDRWRAATQRYQALEASEAGIADGVEIGELSDSLQPLRDRLVADAAFQKNFEHLPIAFGIVELDRLVVYQHRISREHSIALADGIGADASAESLFGLCLPIEPRPRPHVSATSVGHGRFVFQSEVSDFRHQSPALLDSAALRTLPNESSVAAGVGLLVGHGSSHLNVVRFGNRMVLNNGYHRAYALRSQGVTHVPCVIQAVAHADELAFAGESALIDDYATLFSASRPPLFKDFFDPELTVLLRLRRMRKQIQVTVTVETMRVPG